MSTRNTITVQGLENDFREVMLNSNTRNYDVVAL